MRSTLEAVQDTRDRRYLIWHLHNTWHYDNYIIILVLTSLILAVANSGT